MSSIDTSVLDDCAREVSILLVSYETSILRVSYEYLTFCPCLNLRQVLDPLAPRAMAVLNPIKLTVTNWPPGVVEVFHVPSHPNQGKRTTQQKEQTSEQNKSLGDGGTQEAGAFFGTREVPFSGELFIDEDDFRPEPTPGFNRLVPGGMVRGHGAS